MSRIAYVDRSYVHHRDAMVNIEDRGYQFSDGIYEYIAFYNRTLLDPDLHFVRLLRSLKEISITPPMSIGALKLVIRELIERNHREHGGLYIQVTRGVARRDHPFPKHTKPVLVMTICAPKLPTQKAMKEGMSVITRPEQRWERRDIKSISLLANILAKQEAAKAQARETWLIEDGFVREGAASNNYIVDKSGTLITHPADHHILGGVTRDIVLQLARKNGISVIEKPFDVKAMNAAAEAFLTSTSANVLPIVSIDGRAVGNGKPGPVTQKLQKLYAAHVLKQTGFEL